MELKLIKFVVILSLFGVVICTESENLTKTRNRRKLETVDTTNNTNLDNGEIKQIEMHVNKADRVGANGVNYHQVPIKNPFGVKLYSSRKSSINRHATKNDHTQYGVNTTESNYRVTTLNVELNRIRFKEKADENVEENKDMRSADSTNTKISKETAIKDDEEEEKTLAQQVADGKYGLIQNEIFANGSKRPGILSYLSNSEVPKDTKENLGGLEKDEIWLAEDHILVLRGGKYGDSNDSSPTWSPIDDYVAPNRQVKIPKNPKIPPPFPIQFTDDGPLQFIKGQLGPNSNPQLLFPFPIPGNNTLPFPYGVPQPPESLKNQSIVLPLPPLPFPPFLGNFPPGTAFLTPPPNTTDIDEDDPSIYYPPKYDFYYPQANNSPVPAGPLVPGIILPPPPDFFSPLENDTLEETDDKNETDITFNTITRSPFAGPKYLPVENKSTKLRVVNNRNFKRPFSKEVDSNDIHSQLPKTPTATDPKKPLVAYVFPENTKPGDVTFNSLKTVKNTNLKVPVEEKVKVFNTPVLVPGKVPVYHALPTTSPKPNHITVPDTLSKDIYIVTTPETEQNKIEDIYKNAKPRKPVVYENISPELHPLRSLIRPNVSVSYTGKYGHLPASTPKPFPFPDGKQYPPITGHYITQPPPDITQNTITSTPDINVTPVPIVKKIRIRPIIPNKINPSLSTSSPSKATFYFYEEQPKTEAPKEIIQLIETTKQTTPKKPDSNNEITPVTQYYTAPVSTSKTPIRQFLEETFHASNVFQPYDPRLNNADVPKENKFLGKTNVKPEQYDSNVSPKPVLKYHYVTEVPPILIPSPKIKSLEIQNSGSTGLQKVNLDKGNIRPVQKPFFMPEIFSSPKPPESVQHATPTFAPIKPTLPPPTPDINDTPFIPSNYYATSRPEHIHFTAQEQTLVDDITKNYFTIFGQKIPSGSTTPLTPVKPTKIKTQTGKNVQIIPEDTVKGGNQNKTKTVTVPGPTQSHFEQYLKEITGEDQRDYIVTGVQGKVKKGKGFLPFAALPGVFPTALYPAKSIPLQSFRVEQPIQPYSGLVRKLVYPPSYSTTLRPVVDVEINPQYIQQITPGPRPYPVVQPTIAHQKVPLAHNLGQYLQEITSFTSPTTVNPVKLKNRPTRLLVSPSGTPIKDIDLRNPSNPTVGITDRPLSLESDLIINFKHPLPPVNREAEHIDISKIKGNTYRGGSNIKIVDSPDLTKDQNILIQSVPQKNNFESAKHFFQNLPNSGYFSPSHQPISNSFVSYNLPGNGGHFYFLTPQILDNPSEQQVQNRGSKYHITQIPSRTTQSASQHRNNYRRNYSTDLGHNLTNGYSNHDYLRRRRKKS